MVRGWHYYSYITDCSQSKQREDGVCDPLRALSQDTKGNAMQTLGWDVVCKLHSQIVLVFILLADKCWCMHTKKPRDILPQSIP